jgi:hypothetical protein
MMVEGQIQLEASSGRMAQVEEPGLRGGEAGGGEGLGAVTEGKEHLGPAEERPRCGSTFER